uniref:Lipid phosphate phosphatase 3 n=1 Tax=Eimeria tenella TaxID=5802 RepID=A0A0A7H9C0_EIMTE|nr:lipid phosphate phosphatase 3 [Eimeria tenella]
MQLATAGSADSAGIGRRRSLWDDEGCRPLSAKSATVRLSVHLVCVALLGAFVIWGLVADPPVRGFYCNDTTIRYPLKAETVPASVATALVIGIPIVIFVAIELLNTFVVEKNSLASIELKCCSLPRIVGNMYVVCGGFAFGILLNFSLANVAKLCIGRLRPHFLAVCQPNWGSLKCSDSTGDLYVDQYECRGADQAAIKEARLSFFSGHSSNSSCAMLYTIIYLQCRLSKASAGPLMATFRQRLRSNSRADWLVDTAAALRPFIQGALLIPCLFIALSRVMDFFHHPGDVLTGLIVGTLIAFYSALYVSRLPQLPHM